MPFRSANPLVLHRETHRIVYRLEGHDLKVGDSLEVWTTLGWVLGVFTWDVALCQHPQGLGCARAVCDPDQQCMPQAATEKGRYATRIIA